MAIVLGRSSGATTSHHRGVLGNIFSSWIRDGTFLHAMLASLPELNNKPVSLI